jgi:hypothetical protein
MTESSAEYSARLFCRRPEVAPRQLEPDLDPHRRNFIFKFQHVWTNGTRLHYCFLEQPPPERAGDADAVREAFQEWKDVGIGLEFQEVSHPEEAEIRIAFRNDGAWSYVGRWVLNIRNPKEPTMNFGWPLTDRHGRDTALHEIGHALGLEHEHQNHRAGIEWDEAAVLAYFSGSPNFWTPEEIRHNVLDKVPMAGAGGSNWDPDSIMQYPFEAGLIRKPERYLREPLNPAGRLSDTDRREIKQLYPELPGQTAQLQPFEFKRLALAPGEQTDFVIKPEFSRSYTISTFGALDTVMVLYELIDGVPHYVKGDDDSGTDRNAQIVQRLVKDREYRLSIRLYYAFDRGECAVTLW